MNSQVCKTNRHIYHFCNPEAYLEPSQTSTMKPICENSYRVLAAHRRCFICNHFHNILRLFDVLTNFPFTTNETMRD